MTPRKEHSKHYVDVSGEIYAQPAFTPDESTEATTRQVI